MAEPPKALYKYVAPERIDILEKLLIRFTPVMDFNDPFEARFCIDGLEDPDHLEKQLEIAERVEYRRFVIQSCSAGRRLIPPDKLIKRQTPGRMATIRKVLRNPQSHRERAEDRAQEYWGDLGILSLSAAENHLLMWAHYANSHTGMVIEFNPKSSFFKPSNKPNEIGLGSLAEVIYSHSRPSQKLGDNAVPRQFCVKSEDWTYEHEWRVFQALELSCERLPIGGETIHLFRLPPDAIKRVILGCRMDWATRQKVCGIIDSNERLRRCVQVWRSHLSTDSFSVCYEPYRR